MNGLQARYAGEGLAIVAIDVDQRQDDALRSRKPLPTRR
jgi:hypothetical protein